MGGSGLWAAILGWAFTYYNAQVQEQRKARIERVNQQLRDFYGPLLACVTATKSAYIALIRQHSPDGTHEALQRALMDRPDGPEARAYRQWMTSVLQPLNEKAAAIVQGGFSLLEGNSLEPQLLQLVAHVSATRVILESVAEQLVHSSTQQTSNAVKKGATAAQEDAGKAFVGALWAQGELTTTSAISYPDKLEELIRHEYARVRARQAELLGVEPPKLTGRPHAAHVHSMKPGHDQKHKAAGAVQMERLPTAFPALPKPTALGTGSLAVPVPTQLKLGAVASTALCDSRAIDGSVANAPQLRSRL